MNLQLSEIQIEHPWAFAGMLLVPLVVWAAVRSYAYLGIGRRLASAAVRSLAIACLCAAMALPSVPETRRLLCRAVVVDSSVSVPDEALRQALALVRDADRLRPSRDRLFVVRFSTGASFLDRRDWGEIAKRSASVQGTGGTAGTGVTPSEQTDILGAIAYARSVLPEDCSRRIVLVTDGHDTVSGIDRIAGGVREAGIPVDVVAAGGEHPLEVIVDDLNVPARVRTRHPFRVRASVFASGKLDGVQVRLMHTGPDSKGETVEERTVDLEQGATSLTFTTQVVEEGEHLFHVEVEPPGGRDAFPENNFFEAATEAAGPPVVLYVEGEPSRGTHFANALEVAGFEVDARGAGGLPGSAAELQDYVAVIVSDVPWSAIGAGKAAALKAWVKAGGVLVVAGGKDGYQMGGYRGTAIEPLLAVNLDVPTDVEKSSAAVILVIDVSGSMSGAPIEMAREAAKASVSVLQPDDLVEIIAFDSTPRRLFMMQPAKNQMVINSFISKLRSGGGTDIVKALDLAYRDLAPVQAKKKHIVLLTDGQSSELGIELILQNASSDGITISTIGLGASVNRGFLEKIASATGGKSSFTNDPDNLPRLFMREMRVVTPSTVVEGVMKVQVAKQAPFLAKAGSSFPYLRGYNLTTAKGGGASPVLVSDRGDPVLAMWKQGAGWSVSYTSDVKARWASAWVKWEGYARFWGALLKSLTVSEERSEDVHSVEFARQGRLVTATVDLVDRDSGLFLDGMEGVLRVKPFGGTGEGVEAPMLQVAPGRYEGTFVAQSYGTFIARADFFSPEAPPQPAAGSLNLPYPEEYRRIGVDGAALRSIAAATGGRENPTATQLWDDQTEQRSGLALWPWILAFFVVLVPLDLLTRRLNFSPGRRPRLPAGAAQV